MVFLEERLLNTEIQKSEKLKQTEIRLENYEEKQEKITSLGLRLLKIVFDWIYSSSFAWS